MLSHCQARTSEGQRTFQEKGPLASLLPLPPLFSLPGLSQLCYNGLGIKNKNLVKRYGGRLMIAGREAGQTGDATGF